MMLSTSPWWWAPVLASGWITTVPAHSFSAPARAASIAAMRFMPGVCGVLGSSSSACTTRTPCARQSVTRTSLDLENRAVRPDVEDPAGADQRLLAGGLVDVPAHDHPRLLVLDGAQDRLAAQVARAVDVALGRRVDDENRALRAAGQPPRGVVLLEVEAPRPRRDRDAAAQPVERHAVDPRALAVQHVRGAPAAAGLAQRLVGLVVAGDEDRRRLDHHEHVDELLEPAVHRG